jgi:hypothetical protein
MPRIKKGKKAPSVMKTEAQLLAFIHDVRRSDIVIPHFGIPKSKPVLIKTSGEALSFSFYLKGMEVQHGGEHDGSLVLVMGDLVR